MCSGERCVRVDGCQRKWQIDRGVTCCLNAIKGNIDGRLMHHHHHLIDGLCTRCKMNVKRSNAISVTFNYSKMNEWMNETISPLIQRLALPCVCDAHASVCVCERLHVMSSLQLSKPTITVFVFCVYRKCSVCDLTNHSNSNTYKVNIVIPIKRSLNSFLVFSTNFIIEYTSTYTCAKTHKFGNRPVIIAVSIHSI